MGGLVFIFTFLKWYEGNGRPKISGRIITKTKRKNDERPGVCRRYGGTMCIHVCSFFCQLLFWKAEVSMHAFSSWFLMYCLWSFVTMIDADRCWGLEQQWNIFQFLASCGYF